MNVEFIIPKIQFNVGEFKRLANANAEAAALAVKRDYEATTRTWERRPTFSIERTKDAVTVGTDSKTYQGMDDGVPAHPIVHRRSPVLRFQRDYTAKTQPGVIGSKKGGKSGDIWVAKQVFHPGIHARKFTDAIQKKHEQKFYRGGDKAVDAAIT